MTMSNKIEQVIEDFLDKFITETKSGKMEWVRESVLYVGCFESSDHQYKVRKIYPTFLNSSNRIGYEVTIGSDTVKILSSQKIIELFDAIIETEESKAVKKKEALYERLTKRLNEVA